MLLLFVGVKSYQVNLNKMIVSLKGKCVYYNYCTVTSVKIVNHYKFMVLMCHR